MTKFERDAILQPGEYASIPKDVLALKGLTPAAKLVYIMLLEAEGPGRRNTIQDREIAAKTGLSRRTVQAARHRLTELGVAAFTTNLCPRDKRGQFKAGNPGRKRGGIRCNICALDKAKNGAKAAPINSPNGAKNAPTCIDNPSIDNPSQERAAKAARPPRPRPPKVEQPEKKSKAHPRDPHADAFKAAFDAFFGADYDWKKQDFVQLAEWRKKNPNVTPKEFTDTARLFWEQGTFCPSYAATIGGLAAAWNNKAKVKLKGIQDRGSSPPKKGIRVPIQTSQASYEPDGAVDFSKGVAA